LIAWNLSSPPLKTRLAKEEEEGKQTKSCCKDRPLLSVKFLLAQWERESEPVCPRGAKANSFSTAECISSKRMTANSHRASAFVRPHSATAFDGPVGGSEAMTDKVFGLIRLLAKGSWQARQGWRRGRGAYAASHTKEMKLSQVRKRPWRQTELFFLPTPPQKPRTEEKCRLAPFPGGKGGGGEGIRSSWQKDERRFFPVSHQRRPAGRPISLREKIRKITGY